MRGERRGIGSDSFGSGDAENPVKSKESISAEVAFCFGRGAGETA